LCPFCRVLI